MKKTVLFIILISCSIYISQSQEYENCKDAKTVAIKDFNSGNYICKNIDYVEFASLDNNFEQFFRILIYSKYSIRIDHFDSKIFEKDFCYSNTMDSLVYDKFGQNIYSKVRLKAKEIYNTTSEFEKSKLLDLSKTYTNIDSYPKFIGNDKIIIDYLSRKFQKVKNSDYNTIDFTIDINGTILDFEVNFDLTELINKAEVLRELNSLGKFISGYLFGIKVKSKTWFYFD